MFKNIRNVVYQGAHLARYEFVMLWRRSILRILTGTLIALLSLLSLAYGSILSNSMTATESILIASWAPVSLLLILFLPLLLADSIPRDRLLHMRELQRSTPAGVTPYLAGKIAGAWLSVMTILTGLMVVFGGIWYVLLGSFDLMIYLFMWLGAGGFLTLTNGIAGLLLATPARTRQQAFAIVATVVGGGILYSVLIQPPAEQMIYIMRVPLVNYFLQPGNHAPNTIWLTVGVGLVQVGCLSVGAWWWLRRDT